MRSATVLTEKRAGKMGLSEGVLSLNSQILAVLIDSINWHDLYVRAGTLEFLFSVFFAQGMSGEYDSCEQGKRRSQI